MVSDGLDRGTSGGSGGNAARQRPAAAGPRRHRILVVALVVLGFLVAVGAVAGFVLYDRATAIDRSTPAIVADQFLESALIHQDPARVGLFTCRGWPPSEALHQVLPRVGPDVGVSWGDIVAEETGGSARVFVQVRFSLSGGGAIQRQIESWQLQLVREDGWRVCSLRREASARATPSTPATTDPPAPR